MPVSLGRARALWCTDRGVRARRGTQFFVCLGPLTSLDNKYTVFGKLTKGEDVLKRIAAAETVKGDIPFRRQGIERVDPL